jgi:uncharacterized protein GlcG (DUF336 family)
VHVLLDRPFGHTELVGDAGVRASFRHQPEHNEGFFDAVSRLVRLPLIPGPGSLLIRSGEGVLGAAGASGASGGASGDDDRTCVEAGLRAVSPG